MVDDLNKNQSVSSEETGPEVFTIPEEFYGGIAKKPSAPVSIATISGGLSVPETRTATGSAVVKTPPAVKSSKLIIIITAVFLILAIGGFTYYYVHQAQVVREKLKPPPSVVNVPISIPVPPPPPPPVLATTAPVAATSTPTPAPSAIFPFRNYVLSLDTDKDGLTDVEEGLYGTDPKKPDTDNDGYLDGTEVVNLYNPLGYKPVRLLDSGKIKIYLNPTYNYSIYYPSVWIAQALDANNEQVMFSSDTGEFIEVAVADNTLKLPVKDWYLAQSPGVKAEDLKVVTTKEKVDGVISPDGLAAYLPFEDKIFVINYNIGLKTEINFLSTFTMMLNSFRVHGSLEGLSAPNVTATTTLALSSTSTLNNVATTTQVNTSTKKK